ncbi:CaiB/BaiF CoA transferase family protein [Streptomyces lavendulae]|uniref:CaiB/BaiF CoA transferase family protein n=1 Tax=Streptomyces lavendulae TaxID=1914 RepID=UPI0024A0F564|nr:CoA transferase [Streptomyces lavendulae]GLX19603.1 CoA transferase [Streptomyces lavendulae subsp. lavendulae]GLX27098.1 CoA transferase [Streptomyces lavendulae subsp. lavendulae]
MINRSGPDPHEHPGPTGAPLPLAGLKVIDTATLFAGPFAATLLGDYGAEVVKIEHPDGDPARRYGAQADGVPVWWKVVARNKRSATLDLHTDEGRLLFRRLAADADLVVENFRPGTLERWGLDYATLSAHNPRLVLLRMTGFGQTGPYAHRPGFGTVGEAMSGLAHLTGNPDGPPTLPSFPLADAVAGLTAAFAALTALRARELTGRGQVVDLSIVESMLGVLAGPLTTYDLTGVMPTRQGNRSPNNAPRNVYRTKDGHWVAVAATTVSVAERVVRLVGRPELADEPWFATGAGRAAHTGELDAAVGGWIAERTRDEVVDAFDRAQAAIGAVYDFADVLQDPHLTARRSIVSVPDPELDAIRMPDVAFRLSDTPGSVRWAGPRLGEHTAEILDELGVGSEELSALAERGVI